VDVGVGLIEREQGAAYNLRNCHILRAPTQLLEVMDNPHSTKTYETPMVLFQSVLDQATGDYATGNYAGKNECIDSKDMKHMVFLTQMTAKAGTRLYGEEAVQALMQEFAQLEDLGVFLAKSANELTREQKGEAL